MNTKLSVALLSGISLFMSIGAYAISDEENNELNWSYAMGGTMQAEPGDFDELTATLPTPQKNVTCTEGCPARAPKKELTLTYEDEAMTLRDRVETVPEETASGFGNQISVRDKMAAKRRIPARPDYSDKSQDYQSLSQSYQATATEKRDVAPDYRNVSFGTQGSVTDTVSYRSSWEGVQQQPQNPAPQVETKYVESNPQVQYPITRQYPISVQYPVTVQRNMTVEQPVIMQQPVIVRRPVVVQQDVTVRRQPTVIQQQPMVMQQQPSFIQQKPMVLQAPAVPMNQETLNSINGMLAQPQVIQMPQMQVNAMPMVQSQTPAMQPDFQMPMGQNPATASQMMPMMQPQLQTMQMPEQNMGMIQGTYMPYAQQYQVQGQIQAQPIYTQTPAMYQAPALQQQMSAPQQTQAF